MGKKLEKVKRFEFTFIIQINRLSMIYMDVRLSQVFGKGLNLLRNNRGSQ